MQTQIFDGAPLVASDHRKECDGMPHRRVGCVVLLAATPIVLISHLSSNCLPPTIEDILVLMMMVLFKSNAVHVGRHCRLSLQNFGVVQFYLVGIESMTFR